MESAPFAGGPDCMKPEACMPRRRRIEPPKLLVAGESGGSRQGDAPPDSPFSNATSYSTFSIGSHQ
jgi:hypothetical protein